MKRNREKHHAGRITGLLIVLCMIMSLLPTIAFAANPGQLSFTCQSQAITGGSIFYKEDTGDFIQISEENDRYNPVTPSNASIAIRFEAKEGYQLDTTRGVTLWVNGDNRFHSSASDIAEFTSAEGHTFNLSELIDNGTVSDNSFELEFGFEREKTPPGNGSNPGENPPPGGGSESDNGPAHGGYVGERKTAFGTITGKADFFINDSRMVNGEDSSFDNVSYTYDGNGKVDFYFNCFINERLTSLKINGADYFGRIPTPDTPEGREALLAACKGQLNEFKITVPYSESGYAIESSVKWLDDTDKDYMVVGNFLWTYTDENQGDDYIDHGRMELIKVEYQDTDYSPENLDNPGTAMDWSQDENGGSAVLPVGSVVTVKLIPDYGYQLTSFGINGGSFGTGDEQSTFTFEIKSGNAHLGAHFTPVEDKVTSSSGTVRSGSIELGSGLSGGSAQLEINDAENELSVEKLEAFKTAANHYTITDYLNLDLYNVYYKGSTNADDAWKNEINTLDNDATISVSLADSPLAGTVDRSNIVIIHNIHNGEDFETIPVDSYDSRTNTITFKTDSFSTYAISVRAVAIDDSTDSSDNDTTTQTSTGWKDRGQNSVYYENGKKVTDWKEIDGKTYYFDENGYLCHDWLKLSDRWYYLDEKTGIMQTGWVKDGETWYYLNEDHGAMQADSWVQWNDVWYYCGNNGAMYADNWVQWNDIWYYCGHDGAMYADRWVQWNGIWYYCGHDGAMLTNTMTPDGYYVDGEGKWIS